LLLYSVMASFNNMINNKVGIWTVGNPPNASSSTKCLKLSQYEQIKSPAKGLDPLFQLPEQTNIFVRLYVFGPLGLSLTYKLQRRVDSHDNINFQLCKFCVDVHASASHFLVNKQYILTTAIVDNMKRTFSNNSFKKIAKRFKKYSSHIF
jgi:hypothetical protein